MTMKKTTNVQLTQPTIKKRIADILMYLCIQFSFLFTCCSVCFASENYAQNGAEWLLKQLFWVALCAVLYVMLKLFIARNFVAGLVTLVVGGIVLFFIKNPETIETIGEAAATALKLK